jgi:hypothetical protein
VEWIVHNSVVLRLAGAAVLAFMAGSAMTAPANAFVGLSDKQADEVSEFIKCQTYLLKGDLASFDADSDCGHGPVVFGRTMAGERTPSAKHHDQCYEWPNDGRISVQTEGGGYCYPMPE